MALDNSWALNAGNALDSRRAVMASLATRVCPSNCAARQLMVRLDLDLGFAFIFDSTQKAEGLESPLRFAASLVIAVIVTQ